MGLVIMRNVNKNTRQIGARENGNHNVFYIYTHEIIKCQDRSIKRETNQNYKSNFIRV